MRIAFAVGGTKGHILPAEILAKKLSEEGHEVVFLGKGLEKGYYSKTFPFHEIASSNRLSGSFSIARGWIKALWQLKSVDFLIAFGSYHTFSTLLAAASLKIPYVLYEPNVLMGKVNRLFSKKAKRVYSPFLQKKGPVTLVHPITLFSIKKAQKKSRSHRKILVFGGSQGSVFLNTFFIKAAPFLQKSLDFSVIHIAGKNSSVSDLKQKYIELGILADVYPFVEDMQAIYSEVDVAFARAGAGAFFELLSQKIPTFFVPYPHGEKHQLANATFAKQLGFADFSEERLLTIQRFVEGIKRLLEKACFKRVDKFLHQKRLDLSEIVKEVNRCTTF